MRMVETERMSDAANRLLAHLISEVSTLATLVCSLGMASLVAYWLSI